MSNKRNDRKKQRRIEALERNARAGAMMRTCGHIHGTNVACPNPGGSA